MMIIKLWYRNFLSLAAILLITTVLAGERKVIQPVRPDEPPSQSSAPRLGGILSPGILAGDTLYCAGQGSRNPKSGEHPEGFELKSNNRWKTSGRF